MTKATRFPFLLSLLSLCILLLLSINAMQSAFASGETIISNASATTELKIATTISDISINGVGDDNISVKLLVTSGTLSMTTTTNLTFKDANGNVVSNPQTGSTLYFSGLRSDVNVALATLHYTRNTTGTDTLEISLVNPGEVFFSGNDHLYEYVSSTLDWNAAKTAAEGVPSMAQPDILQQSHRRRKTISCLLGYLMLVGWVQEIWRLREHGSGLLDQRMVPHFVLATFRVCHREVSTQTGIRMNQMTRGATRIAVNS